MTSVSVDQRRALLVAVLGFLQLREQPPEVAPLRRWLGCWRGIGAVVTGMEHQGCLPDPLLGGMAVQLHPPGRLDAAVCRPTRWSGDER